MTVALATIMVRLLVRDEWGQAMLAELNAIEAPRARRRFARGCLRAALRRKVAWARLGAIALVAAVPAFMLTGPGGGGDLTGLVIFGVVVATCLAATVLAEDPLPAVSVIGGLLWWAGILASGTVRAHPQWALALVAACGVTAALRAGAVAGLGAAFAVCLSIFVVAVGTYCALPRLAPDVVPANARDRVAQNQVESTDPYVGELLLAGLLGLALIGAARDPRPAHGMRVNTSTDGRC